MTRSEYWFRWTVTRIARPIPVESPGWATVCIFAPNLVSYFMVKGTIQAAGANLLVASIFTKKGLFWTEVGIHIFMACVGIAFLCRLLQICDPRYFDNAKLEEAQ